ncbi:MAG TPA: ABC transporter ATP-binding protein [Firmicutes bacterium]|nr:ABC transporter ATP-binding protein [Bacillota bacterium]
MFLEVAGLKRIYTVGKTTVAALDGVDFGVEKGAFVVVLGPSGSGKSTLINIIGGIDRADAGRVVVEGQDIARLDAKGLTEYRRNSVGFVFQFYNLVSSLTAYENVLATAYLSRGSFDAGVILDLVGMSDKKNKFPFELSGGEQQRVAIARAVVKNPKLLLCDEPTGALDYDNAKKVLGLLEKVNRELGTTVLLITHNTAIARMAHVVIRLRSGRVVERVDNPTPIASEQVVW